MSDSEDPDFLPFEIYRRVRVYQDQSGHAAAQAWKSLFTAADKPHMSVTPWSYHVYVTHDIEDLEDFAEKLLYTLTVRQTLNTIIWRLEIFLLPSASVQDCKAHYNAERDARSGGGSSYTSLTQYQNTSNYMGFTDIIFILGNPDWEASDSVKVLQFTDEEEVLAENTPLDLEDSGDPEEEMGFRQQLRHIWHEDEQKYEVEDDFDPRVASNKETSCCT